MTVRCHPIAILDRMSNRTQYCTRSAATLVGLGRCSAGRTAPAPEAAITAAAG